MAHVKPMIARGHEQDLRRPGLRHVALAEMRAVALAVGVDGFKSIMLGQALDYGHARAIFLAITGNIDTPGGRPCRTWTRPFSPATPRSRARHPYDKGFALHRPRTGAQARQVQLHPEPTWYETQAIKDDGLKILMVNEANPAPDRDGQPEVAEGCA